jgi:hypothetical protein
MPVEETDELPEIGLGEFQRRAGRTRRRVFKRSRTMG